MHWHRYNAESSRLHIQQVPHKSPAGSTAICPPGWAASGLREDTVCQEAPHIHQVCRMWDVPGPNCSPSSRWLKPGQMLGADLGSRAAAEQHLGMPGPEPLELGTFFTETGSVSSRGTFQDTILAGNRVVFSIEPRDVSPWSEVSVNAQFENCCCCQTVHRSDNKGPLAALQEAAGEKRSVSEVSSALEDTTHGRVVSRGKA
ncbi:unnamed protein product [Arctogadus glacialis]